ncbi:NUDIX hydrolase [Halobacillus amylolyticus]|uniref:CoA pyrophosphatase n=1 Tax=Halobacillus amylolyticus TaxID=2932259 RepID=A0ABY4HGJ7_9BACI|nr:CoA pyrophosphatase [Halobacillus amylolyticus]UOR13666.1 CoA pyrophosphatase [Halobacillus amylolyticus]
MDTEIILNKVNQHTPSILGSQDFSKFAILLPLVEKDNEWHVLFEVRSQKLRRQPGDICFPGGKIDRQDKTEKGAAIRETTEELGINHENISDVFPLDYIVSPFGMIVYPYAGFINDHESIKPNPAEVEDFFTVPLSFFLKTEPQVHKVSFEAKPEEDFPFDLIVGGQDYDWRTRQIDEYFYIYEDKVIWGLTGKILSHFVEIVR